MRDLYPCPYRVSSKIKESETYSKIDSRVSDDNIIDDDSDGGDDYYDNNNNYYLTMASLLRVSSSLRECQNV